MIWIVGSCSMENEEFFLDNAYNLDNIMKNEDWFLKGSFDKANRSSITGSRGPGLREGIKILTQIKKQIPHIKTTTDVHETYQVKELKEVVDCIQIPAFLCRQTDLLIECARYFNIINIKKGQWISPDNIVKGIDKIKNTNPDAKIWLTERGTQFGYTKLLVDFSIVDFLKKYFDKVIFDCTHSTQRLKENGRTGGDSTLAERYIKAASIFNYDGVFADVHPNPSQSPSDADSQIDLKNFKKIKNEL